MANLVKIVEVGKKVIPLVGGAVVGLAVGIVKGHKDGFKQGYEKASKEYANKFRELINRFEEYKRKRRY